MSKFGCLLIDESFIEQDSLKELVSDWFFQISFLPLRICKKGKFIEFRGYSPFFMECNDLENAPVYKLEVTYEMGRLAKVRVALLSSEQGQCTLKPTWSITQFTPNHY